eukprot:TRINITY_DN2476_c0_g1_i4.p1 TRINITY_DN2476_c0_g1~~TRINITY_DN2476_c0_g1_i4.p1  ORF type:complete len:136 (+),score=3.01 TRINITY_DN2476_c0_g1_i4:132-539(+)
MAEATDLENGNQLQETEILKANGPGSDKEYLPVAQEAFRRHLGNHFILSTDDMGDPELTIGPHWPFFACMFSFLGGVGIMVAYYISTTGPTWGIWTTIVITLTTLTSYTVTALKNPGIVSSRVFVDDTSFANDKR